MASKEALQEELNPFEIAKQQFNRAADYLELDDSTRHVLSSAKRQLIVSIPVKMDGGDVQVFEAGGLDRLAFALPARAGERDSQTTARTDQLLRNGQAGEYVSQRSAACENEMIVVCHQRLVGHPGLTST